MSIELSPQRRRCAISFLSIVVCYIAYVNYADWLLLNQFGTPSAVLRLFGGTLVAALIMGLIKYLANATTQARVVFALWILFLSIVQIAYWPGLVMSDAYAAYKAARVFPVDTWLGYGFVFWCSTFMQIAPEFWFIVLVQTILASWVISATCNAFCVGTFKRAILINLLFASSIPFLANAILPSRDMLFAINAAALIVVYAKFLSGQQSPNRLVTLGLLSSTLIFLRTDGLAMVAAAFLLMFWRTGAGKAFKTAAVWAICSATLFIALPLATGKKNDEFAYRMSLALNPLGYILQRDYEAADPKQLRRVLDRVVDISLVEDFSEESEIPVLWSGGLRREASQADQDEFFRAYYGLIKDNPGLFLEGRLATFFGATGLGRRTLTFVDVDVSGNWGQMDHGFYDDPQPISKIALPAHEALRKEAITALAKTGSGFYAENPLRSIVWNFIPHLAILVIFALCWKISPVASACSVVLLARVPLLFIFEPASHFKYYLFLVVGCFCIIALAAFERSATKEHATREMGV